MEPTSLLLVAVTYAGALVARKITDDAATALWSRMKAAWRKSFSAEPQATDLTAESVDKVSQDVQGVADALEELMRNSPALRRLRRVKDAMAGSRILWIDDHPEWNSWEIACLEAAGVRIRTVETTRAGLAVLPEGYDVVISDIDRGASATEGLTALPALRRDAPETPVIFYVGALQPNGVPAGAFGITDRPDELLHLVMDVIERTKL